MDKILEVKDLKISFRTSGGTLKAVRDISFDLERGKTLAIVGESGSGKSVTSKAILGILAGNSIIEGGEILYDGKDLLRISEEDMCKIRGDKISMIFQDPLSSLNPIVKIGKQITEAMILKNRASRKTAKKSFNTHLALLKKNMLAANDPSLAGEISELVKTLDKMSIEGNKLENIYNKERTEAADLLSEIEDFLFKASKKQRLDVKKTLSSFEKELADVKDPFLTAHYEAKLKELSEKLAKAKNDYVPQSKKDESATVLSDEIIAVLEEAKPVLEAITTHEAPNFFRIGYYKLKNPNASLTEMPVDEFNAFALKYLDDNFMNRFIELETKGVEYSFNVALEKKKTVLEKLAAAKEFYLGDFNKADAYKLLKELSKEVEDSIDRLETNKDSVAYTFKTALGTSLDKYFFYLKNNPKEERRFAKQSAKREALVAKGKHVSWKVVPKVVFDTEELKANIVAVISRLEKRYADYIAAASEVDFRQRSVDIIDYFKDKASQVVYKVTPNMAKERAIKLMEEVGIHEPRTRYYQYPFEFSGGMRQRIVIAIALAADPDIIICDEPTTALDVTIQAQILELINNLKKERNLSVIFITHDLGVVANMADDIAVMYAGKIVEYGTADDVFYDPRHPYTWALLSSMPDLDTKEKLDAIPGTPPNMIYPPKGDAFAERNKYAMEIDFEECPPFFPVSETHKAATWLLHPDAPKVNPPKAIQDRIQRMLARSGGEQDGE